MKENKSKQKRNGVNYLESNLILKCLIEICVEAKLEFISCSRQEGRKESENKKESVEFECKQNRAVGAPR